MKDDDRYSPIVVLLGALAWSALFYYLLAMAVRAVP